MLNISDLNFDFNSTRINFYGSYAPGNAGHKIKREVDDGSNVTLRKGKINIQVKDIKKSESESESESYSGVVQFVDPYRALSNDGVNEGVKISFSYRHIFACYHK